MKITQEMVFKTYDDNQLIPFEVILTKHQGRPTVQVFGMPSEPLDYDGLCRVIKCLKSAKKNWENCENFEDEY